MAPNKLYSNVILRAVRIIALITVVLLCFTTPRIVIRYYTKVYGKGLPTIYTIAPFTSFLVNITTIVFGIILIFHPQKFFFIGIGSLLQSLSIASFDSFSYMSLLMLGIATGTFLVRATPFFSKKRIFTLITIVYIYELLFPLLYDDTGRLDFLIQKFGSTFAFLICIFFLYQFAKQKGIREGSKDKVLNLAQFKGLDRSDMILLQDIMTQMKYKEIAQKIHGSEGALRNKLSRIYKILEVGDRTGFLTIYSGYELIYDPEVIEKENK